MHPLNKHQGQYDFKVLIAACTELEQYVFTNKYGTQTIDFFNPEAVKALNHALLSHYYNIRFWDIPKGALCPPIPSRADYIHHIAKLIDLPHARVLDIGVGANCIYPIIGYAEYGWRFTGSDIDPRSIECASEIIARNPTLHGTQLRLQPNKNDIFRGIIRDDEYFDLTICNPPFHSSAEDAARGSIRKLSNLTGKKIKRPILNFAGQSNELWCDGGEEQFLRTMIAQSREFAQSVGWFSSLVSKQTNISKAEHALRDAEASNIRIIEMTQGNKTSRIIAWHFR